MTSIPQLHSPRTNVRQHNSSLTLARVGGTKHSIRAIYGSTDSATMDHKNDPLCKVALTNKPTYTNDPQYRGAAYNPKGFVGRASEMLTVVSQDVPVAAEPQTFDLAALLARAARKGMTLVQYCALIGVQI